MAKPKRPVSRTPRPALGLPDRDALSAFIAEKGETDLSEIARAFGVKGAERRALRHLINDLTDTGGLARRGRKGVAKPGALPPVGVVEVVSRDDDGDLFVRLVKADEDEPLVRLAPSKGEAGAAPGVGDRLLAKFERRESGDVEAQMIKRLGGQGPERLLGVVRRTARDVRLEPVDRKIKESLILIGEDARELRDGDLAVAAIARAERFGPKRGKVLEVIGREDDPRAASLIAIHANSIPTGFSEAAEREAAAAKPPELKGREDLRDLPLITIDPVDARDHDDAVYAHADPDVEGGWVVWAAIADVAAYVMADPAYADSVAQIERLILTLLPRYRAEGKSYVTIAFGCTGGRHRSVHVASRVAQTLRESGYEPVLTHRNLDSAPQDGLEGKPPPASPAPGGQT